MDRRRCLLLLYSEIRRNEGMSRLASAQWQKQYFLEVAEAITEAANAMNGREAGICPRLVTRFGLFLQDRLSRRERKNAGR